MTSLKEIVSRVLDISITEVNDELVRDKTEEWDSFNHLLLISEIEKELGVKFTIQEVEKINNFNDLKQMIFEKNENKA